MLAIEADFVKPVFRPPLCLAIVFAALKFGATAWLLEDPLLKTKKDTRKLLEDESAGGNAGGSKQAQVMIKLVLRLVFSVLAAYTFVQDVATLASGFAINAWPQRFHGIAMVLAFSPNTASGVAAACTRELTTAWSGRLPGCAQPDCRSSSELIALLYGHSIASVYVPAFLIVGLLYGFLGALIVTYAMLRDLLTLPYRLYEGSLNDIWIALPVFLAYLLWTATYNGIILFYFFLVKRRYPDLAARMKAAGAELKPKRELPHKVAARMIGMARDAAVVGGTRIIGNARGEASPELQMLEADLPLAPEKECEEEIEDACIMNDHGLALVCSAKVFLCITVPMIQLAVIVATRVYLGMDPWNAALHSFQERTWAHYFLHVSEMRAQDVPSLLWLYL